MSIYIDPFTASELQRIRRKVDNIRGEHVRSGPDFVEIGRGSTSRSDAQAEGWFWAIVKSSARDGQNWRWLYQIAAAEKTGKGYAGEWKEIDGGRGGDAYNTMERINGTTGQTGIGVSIENLAGLQIMPVPNGTPVRVYPVPGPDDGEEFWFSEANGLDGLCTQA